MYVCVCMCVYVCVCVYGDIMGERKAFGSFKHKWCYMVCIILDLVFIPY